MDIKLTLISDIYEFIDVAQKHPSEVRLFQGNYSVSGKSVLGIFSLNLNEKFVCITDDGEYNDFKKFLNHI